MNDRPELADVPLWYASTTARGRSSDWREDHFGGWQKAVGKQWAEEPMCHVGVDKDTNPASRHAAVTVDRAIPPDTGMPPPAPKGHYPADGAVVGIDQVKLRPDDPACDAVRARAREVER